MSPVPPPKNDIALLIDAAHEKREDKPAGEIAVAALAKKGNNS